VIVVVGCTIGGGVYVPRKRASIPTINQRETAIKGQGPDCKSVARAWLPKATRGWKKVLRDRAQVDSQSWLRLNQVERIAKRVVRKRTAR
jgi:hypothetical protein